MKEALRLLALEVAKLSQNQNNNGQFVNYTEYRNNLEQLFDKFRPLEDGIVDVRKLQRRVGNLENYRAIMDAALADAQKVNQLQQSDIKRMLDALAQKANRSELADFEKRAEANAAREALAARLQAQIAEAKATAVAAQGTATSAKVDAAGAGVTAKGALGAAFAANKIAVGAAAAAALATGVAAGATLKANQAIEEAENLRSQIEAISGENAAILRVLLSVRQKIDRAESLANQAIKESKEAEAEARKAFISSELANRKAISAESTAKDAKSVGYVALSTGKTADKKADLALSLAGNYKIQRIENPYNDAPVRSEIAQVRNISNQARAIAEEALTESRKPAPNLDKIQSLATQANQKADQAIAIAKESKSTATTASSKADSASRESKESKAVAVGASNKADNANKEVQSVKPVVPKVQVIEGTVVTINSQVSSFNSQLQSKVSKPEVNETFEQLAQRITNSFKFNDNLILNQFNKTQADIKATAINSQNIATQGKVIQTQTVEKLQQSQQEIATIKKQVTTIETNTVDKTDVQKITQQNNQTQNQINDLVGKLPGMIAISLLGIRPTVGGFTPEATEQLTTAAAAGTCRTTAPGGCTGKKFDQLQQGMDRNTQQINQLSNAPALAGNVQNAALQQSINGVANTVNGINTKLGGLITAFNNFAKWMHLDRVLNIMIFAATIHNAAMLSNDLLQTLVGSLNNVISLIAPKDANGNSFNLTETINGTVETTVKGIIGSENYTTISQNWANASRIYQASMNVVNNVLNLSQVILMANEMIAGYTGKIGNALKKGGVVLENAYGWMNPQPKFNRVTAGLENLQAGASTIQMVTQIPIDAVNAVTELRNSENELRKTLKEDDKPANKATEIPEPDALKATETALKTASQPVVFDFSDMFDGEDL